MSWVRLDDRYPRSPKVMGLTDKAFRTDVEAMCYCAEQNTDGHLPDAYLRGVPKRIREALVTAGRWDLTEDGLFVHDFLEYNPSANERDAKSEAASNAARMRWASGSQSASDASTTRGRVGERQEEESRFAEFWDVYPRHEAKRAARAAFTKALRVAPFEEILKGAIRYRDNPKRHPDFTAHPTTWLNQGRWEDEDAVAIPKNKDARYQPYDHEAHLRELEDIG